MFPFDAITVAVIFGMVVGLIAGEAALFGDTLSLHINVAAKLVQAGFDSASAEQIFIAESARIVRGESIIPTPTLRLSSRPTVVSALASPLRLESLVGALQDQLGFQRLVVNATVLAGAGEEVRMLIVVAEPPQTQEQLQVIQADGDLAALVRRGADLTMARVSPYRVAQADYLRGLNDDPSSLREARDTASRYLAHPWDPSRASERAMLHNLLALLSLLNGDLAVADRQLKLVEPIPGVLPQVHAAVALNRAFLAVAEKRPEEARAQFEQGEKLAGSLGLTDVGASIFLLGGLVAWSGGDVRTAENQFRAAIAALPNQEGPHAYLAQLLAAQGDQAGAAAEREAAATAHPFDVELPAFAQSIVWVDPVNGGVRRH